MSVEKYKEKAMSCVSRENFKKYLYCKTTEFFYYVQCCCDSTLKRSCRTRSYLVAIAAYRLQLDDRSHRVGPLSKFFKILYLQLSFI